MNKIDTISIIKEDNLDINNYYISLIDYAFNNNMLDEIPYTRIKIDEINLIKSMVKRMTGGSSTSIDRRVAEELYSSTLYNISYYLKTINNPDRALKEIISNDLETLRRKGNLLIENDLRKTKMYINLVIANMLEIDNYYYNSTFKEGIIEALKNYNKDYDATNKVITADYITSIYPSSLGIEFLIEYINNFNLENLFLRNFNTNNINNLLKNKTSNYKDLLINIFDTVLETSISLLILNKDYINLELTPVDIELLYLKLESLSDNQIKDLIYDKLNILINDLELDNKIKEYLYKVLNKLEISFINSIRNDSLNNLLGKYEINS